MFENIALSILFLKLGHICSSMLCFHPYNHKCKSVKIRSSFALKTQVSVCVHLLICVSLSGSLFVCIFVYFSVLWFSSRTIGQLQIPIMHGTPSSPPKGGGGDSEIANDKLTTFRFRF